MHHDLVSGHGHRRRFGYPSDLHFCCSVLNICPSRPSIASLGIYDISGRLVETLVRGDFEAGEHEVIWNAVNHSSGIYFVELTSGKNRSVQKLLLLK